MQEEWYLLAAYTTPTGVGRSWERILSRQAQQLPRDAIPALAIGQGVTLLGVMRGLGEVSVPTYVATPLQDVTRRSRWYRCVPGSPVRSATAEVLAEDLLRLPLDGAVLIPCSDSAAVAVASLPPAVSARFRASCPSAEVQAILADKLRFARVLQRLDVPHPETIEITSPEVIADLAVDELARFFLKPLDSERFSQRYGIKACFFRDREHALSKHERLSGDGQAVVLQEFIQGPATRHYFIDGFVDRHGQVRARFARRRHRMYPTKLGNSTCMASIPLAEVADACTALDRLLGELRFRGIFSAEFKRDPRDEVCKLLEINARPWWYIGFAQTCGVNVVAMAYRDALELDVAEVTDYRTGRWCVYPRLDFKAVMDDARQGRLKYQDWAASWLHGDQPIFAWSDPGPAASESIRLSLRAARKLFPGRIR